MGADHSHHHRAVPAPPGAVRAVLAVIVPLALVTLAALIWMWPDGPERKAAAPGQEPVQMTRVTGTVLGVEYKDCSQTGEFPGDWLVPSEPAPGSPARCGDATVRLTSGPDSGRTVTVGLPTGPGALEYDAGDEVVLLHMTGTGDGSPPYQLNDHDRSNAMWLVGVAFVLAVVAFGRWRGLTALLGLAITFVLLLKFLIPAILEGRSPLLAAIVCAAAIMLMVLYLTHGFTMATSIAVIGTLASLTLTGVLASTAMGMTHLSGVTDESSLNLSLGYDLNLQGLLLAGIIIGSLGVLDDVTVTQAATVTELAHANPAYRFGQLYRAAARVGRAHIASVINTIILAYAGASLPLLLMLSVGEQPLGQVVTGPILAQEIVRSVAGTIGLIAAVPITTALAALTCAGRTRPTPDDDHAPAHPDDDRDPARPGHDHDPARPDGGRLSTRPGHDHTSGHPGGNHAPAHPGHDHDSARPGHDHASGRSGGTHASAGLGGNHASAGLGGEHAPVGPGHGYDSARPGGGHLSAGPGHDHDSAGPGGEHPPADSGGGHPPAGSGGERAWPRSGGRRRFRPSSAEPEVPPPGWSKSADPFA